MTTLREVTRILAPACLLPEGLSELLEALALDGSAPVPADAAAARVALSRATAKVTADVALPVFGGLTLGQGTSVAITVAEPKMPVAQGTIVHLSVRALSLSLPSVPGATAQLDATYSLALSQGAVATSSPVVGTLATTPKQLELPGGVGLSPGTATLDATGFHLPTISLRLPSRLPLLGGREIPGQVHVPPGGGVRGSFAIDTDLVLGGRPGAHLTGKLDVDDPLGHDLMALAPTAGSLALRIPLAGWDPLEYGAAPTGPTAIVARLIWSRIPGSAVAPEITVTLEADGGEPGDGLIRFRGTDGGPRIAATAGVLAAALMAGTTAPNGDGPRMTDLLAAAAAVVGPTSGANSPIAYGEVTLTSARMIADASTDPVLEVDLTAAVQVNGWSLPPISITMIDDRPLRVRWRGVRVVLPRGGPGPGIPRIDLSRARLDVEDPGGWRVDSPMQVLDIVGTRSGSGSSWIEVDLGFALDLGPVTVSGATVRATFRAGMPPEVSLRGLAVSVDIPGVLVGQGRAAITSDGLDVALAGTVVPLRLGALVTLATARGPGGVRTTRLGFGVDLPAPIPLGPTGLGLFGAAGAVTINGGLPRIDPVDPAPGLLGWRPWLGAQVPPRADGTVVGAGIAIGTAPDLGYTFSALGVLGVAAPDLALRAGLNGTFLRDRRRIADLGELDDPPSFGVSFQGGLAADGEQLVIALRGRYEVPLLLQVDVPIAMRFPFQGDDWWIHLGTDNGPARPPGPARVRVLPGILDDGGDGFVMIHGAGIPRLDIAGSRVDLQGFCLAAGVSLSVTFGVPEVLWAEVHADATALLGTVPRLVAGAGSIAGELHAGPFSVGVAARLRLQVGPGDFRSVEAQVCGEVDLVLDSVGGCVGFRLSDGATSVTDPDPADWPFPAVHLADGLGSALPEGPPTEEEFPPPGLSALPAPVGPLTASAVRDCPIVWPDVIPQLVFPVAPAYPMALAPDPSPGYPMPAAPGHSGRTGSAKTAYTWTLHAVRLEELNSHGDVVATVDTTRAAWQLPEGVPADAAQLATARELHLLTTYAGTTLRRRGTPAEGTALPPTLTRRCHDRTKAVDGWCLGATATAASGRPARDIGAWRLSVENRADWAVPAWWQGADGSTGVDGAASLMLTSRIVGVSWWAHPGVLDHGRPERVAPVLVTPVRRFPGLLRLPYLDGCGPRPLSQDERELMAADWIEPDEGPLARAEVVLAVPAGLADLVEIIGYPDGKGSGSFVVARLPGSDGLELVHARWHGDPLVRLAVHRPAGVAASLLGVRVCTLAAVRCAEAEDAGRAAAAATDAATSTTPGAHRTLLAKGRTYRLSVTLGGARTSDDPAIGAADLGIHTRAWVFRTATEHTTGPLAAGPPATSPAEAIGISPAERWDALVQTRPKLTATLRRDRFDPAYLERYLLGWTPGDGANHWYTGDPIAIEFSAGHLLQLAAVYGRSVMVGARRTDRPVDAPMAWRVVLADPTPFARWAHGVRDSALIPGACAIPVEGGTARVSVPLDPRATYEVRCAFPLNGGDVTPGTAGLPPIVIGTSRWASPEGHLAACRFGESVPGAVHGHLVVSALRATTGTVVSDRGLEVVLDAAGLPPLRPVETPRTTAVWQRSPDGTRPTALAGLLVESPEPLWRPGRWHPEELSVAGRIAPASLRDSGGSRWLWAFTDPVPVPTAADVVLTWSQQLGTAPQPRSARLRLSTPNERWW